MFFNFYAGTPFSPQCPEIPESHRIDCAPGEMVSEVRGMGDLPLTCWVLLKRNECVKWGESGGGVGYGTLTCLVLLFLSCLIEITLKK